MPAFVIATESPAAAGGLASAAAVGVVAAAATPGVLLAEVGAAAARRPTLLAAEEARGLERSLQAAGFHAAARGRLTWLAIQEDDWATRLDEAVEAAPEARATVAFVPPRLWHDGLDHAWPQPSAALLRADPRAERALCALACEELRRRGLRARIATRAPGPIATRRALAGLEPGGDTGRRVTRLARGLGLLAARSRSNAGQALPLALGGVLLAIVAALALAVLAGALTGAGRTQRVADLAALSGARSMRDDLPALLSGDLGEIDYLRRAEAAARHAADLNGVELRRVAVAIPDRGSFPPVRVRVAITADVRAPGETDRFKTHAAAVAVLPPSYSPAPPTASGGGYSGPLAYRQGKPMRPDVAAAFDRMAQAAARAGVGLTITSAYRSDAEQARLFAQHPDPRWVAPPGKSLHRCGTELDLGPPAAYSWLAANAGRFGFVARYSWEPWHFGYTRGAAPCSRAPAPDGRVAGRGVPSFVPAAYRASIQAAAGRWSVSAGLLAAQLMAESGFNPRAVSPAGARGIAQFMPGTAAAYGLRDPFDAARAIDAQAHLMADLLGRFGSTPLALAAYNAGPGAVAACGCVPSYPETQAYVARILALMGSAGEVAPPDLEVRLVD